VRHYTIASSRKKKKITAAAATAAANPGNNELHTLLRARLPFPYSSSALPFALLSSAWLGFARCNPRRAKGHTNAESEANNQSVAIGSKK
jgi:hypothetical protein